eukprot:4194782-Amphidinium_carterae.1
MNFEVKVVKDVKELICKVPDPENDHSITDSEALRSFTELNRRLPRYREILGVPRRGAAFLDQLSLQGHWIGDRAVRALVEALLANDVVLGTLELYKNRLGDASAQALAVLVQHSPAPGVRGLHLSHNYMSPAGVNLIITAAAASGHYPRKQARPTHPSQDRDVAPAEAREEQSLEWIPSTALPESIAAPPPLPPPLNPPSPDPAQTSFSASAAQGAWPSA